MGFLKAHPSPLRHKAPCTGNANGFASVLGRDVDVLHACDMTIRFKDELAARLASPLAFCL
jgi:hypothetical protein